MFIEEVLEQLSQRHVCSNLTAVEDDSKSFKLFFEHIHTDKALGLIGSVQRVYAIRSDCTSLHLDLTNGVRCIFPSTVKNACLLNEWFNKLVKRLREAWLLLLDFHIVVNILDPEVFREFPVNDLIDDILILISNSPFSRLFLFSEVDAVQRV